MSAASRHAAVRDLPEVVRTQQCMGCGFCAVRLSPPADAGPPARRPAVTCTFNQDLEHWAPVIDRDALTGEDSLEPRVCPGAVMDMPALAQAVFGREPADAMVGEALRIAAGHATDEALRAQAASGGLTTAILTRLFETKRISVAYCVAGRDPKNGGGILVRRPADLLRATGSHYHPVAFGAHLNALVEGDEPFAFVGLPCEVAAMREFMLARPDVSARCVVLIGLFCGGINRFSGIGTYLRRFGIESNAVTEIDYRDGPWPGQIRAKVAGETAPRYVPRIRGNSRWNILHYMISFQGYWMLPRCRICPDQIADFADLAVGDPHLPRFKSRDGAGYSAVVARTQRGGDILADAEGAGAIALGPLSRDELVQSQGYTLENRRHALVYANMARKLGLRPPKIRVYKALEPPMSAHQHIYAFVDLAKIRFRKVAWLRPFYLPLQMFEYLFLTLSPRLILSRIVKLASNR